MTFRLTCLLITSFLLGCQPGTDISELELQKQIVLDHDIARISDETWYFPAKKPGEEETSYLPLRRFDLIFTGYNAGANSSYERVIPGTYTHMLAYIGKDANGFAYGIEMNTDQDRTYTMGLNGLQVGGQLYLYCLGSDYGKRPCPADLYFFGLERYDYAWAKALTPHLKERLMSRESELMATIKQDLSKGFPFQLPFRVTLLTAITKEIILHEDGRRNGTDCADYFVSLFEQKANVCMNDIRIGADEISNYFLNDPQGKNVVLPAAYNPFAQKDELVSEMLTREGFTIVDNQPRQTLCPEGRVVSGIAIPDRVFNSSSLVTPTL